MKEDRGPTGAPPDVVGPYLAHALRDEAWASCTVTLLAGGRSNLTYLVSSAAGEVILRRPPLSLVLATAHDMAREARVMLALRGTEVPVPQVLCHESDPAILGAPFIVMSRVEGFVIRDELPPTYRDEPAAHAAVGTALINTLASIHQVDWDKVGLANHGRPAGFLERQLRRWLKQWNATRADDVPGLEVLATALAERMPETTRPGLVHGDYRIDNLVWHPGRVAAVAGVLDWELSTIGDTFIDLGHLLACWTESDDAIPGLGFPMLTAEPGCPTRAEVYEMYKAQTGIGEIDIGWYVAFAAFRMAIIRLGVMMRVGAGAMVDESLDIAQFQVPPLVDLGWKALAEGAFAARRRGN
ncbi:phosphotransferase family protein [Mycobacterium sp. NAZ190054]|uniref:phosphotransferase family protein n=1 Tax=Mycobacterium sp. NAZ190054 TaxID=1747766 RepID=UPI00079694FD|nr:phosphotransferase family protein [Mycobacterium sp. NAZ190054]KWX58516.1 hypothetical protein ASJ79_09985 [Mycobacterium sp. NAZ190054]